MNILAFDTSTDNLSVALKTGKGIYTTSFCESLRHSEKLLPLARSLYESTGTDIRETDLIVCAKGPGSFTGLRIGMATAKGIAFGLSVPIVSVPTLDFMAEGLKFLHGAVVPLIDAKRGLYYSAVYSDGKRVSDYLDISADNLVDLIHGYDNIILTGPGSGKFYDEISVKPEINKKSIVKDPLSDSPKIISCLELGIRLFDMKAGDPDSSGPVYVRKSDAEEKAETAE